MIELNQGGAMHLIGGGGLQIEKVQPIEFSFGYSVTSSANVNLYQTIEEADPEKSFIITDSDYVYRSTYEQVRFRMKLDDAFTAHFDAWFAWQCNLCGSFTARGNVYTLKNKPKKLQYAEPATTWPFTVEETDPDSTLFLRACGHHPLNLKLTDSMTLDTDDAYPSSYDSFKLGYYLIQAQ